MLIKETVEILTSELVLSNLTTPSCTSMLDSKVASATSLGIYIVIFSQLGKTDFSVEQDKGHFAPISSLQELKIKTPKGAKSSSVQID